VLKVTNASRSLSAVCVTDMGSAAPDLAALEIAEGGAAAFLGALVAVGVGIGGGPMYLPVLIMLFGNAHVAIPLSKANIFAVSIAALAINVSRRHAKIDRPLINYDVALLLEPMTLVGTVVGVTLNVVLPSNVLVVLCILFLSFTVYKTAKKGMSQYKAEGARVIRQHSAVLEAPVENDNDDEALLRTESAVVRDGKAQEVLVSEKPVPWWKILLLAVVAFSCNFLEYASGGGLALLCGSSGPIAGPVVSYSCLAALVLIALGFTVFWARYLVAKYDRWASLGLDVADVYGENLRWESGTIWRWPAMATVAGLTAGSIGIGGGLVKGPLMLQMGISSTVATSTSSFMILFTSSSTVFQFWMLGRLDPRYAHIFPLFAMVGAIIGQNLLVAMVKKYKRQSLVTLWLCVAISISVACMVVSWALSLGKQQVKASPCIGK